MLNRRGFIKLGASLAAYLTGSKVLLAAQDVSLAIGQYPSPKKNSTRQLIPSACWQCVTRCPIWGFVEQGRVVKIEGNPKSMRSLGKVCAKGQAGVNQVNDPDRILYPLRRMGKRGEGKWKRISWQEALTELSQRLKKLRDEGHAEKLMFHYGRMKASSSKIVNTFLSHYGTKTIGNHTSICEGGKWTAQELTWGRHYDNWDFDQTRYVLNFGSNCLEAHTNHIPVAQRLVSAMRDRGVKMVTFDVRLANTVAKSAEWVPIKPGTDGAVVLAMCHEIVMRDLMGEHGKAFLKFCKVTKNPNATIKQKIAALKTHLLPYTPKWAEQISGVSADKISQIAEEFATHYPAVVISYRGAIAHYNGNETERAVQMLAAITGNIDNPGGRCRGVGAGWKYPHGPEHPPKAKKLNLVDGFKGQVAYPSHHVSHQVFKVIKDGTQGRPDIYMWYCYQPVYSNGDVQETIDVLKDENLLPFTVAISPFYDESSALADLILPDATYLERWDWEDMVAPNQLGEFYIRQPLVKPLAEARDFKDVCCDLAKRLGFPLGYDTAEEFVQLSCEMTPAVSKQGGFAYMKKHGVLVDPEAKPSYQSYMQEVDGKKLKAKDVLFDKDTGVYWNWKKSKAKSRAQALKKGYTHNKNAYKGYIGQRIGDKVYQGFEPDKLNKSGFFELYSVLLEEKGWGPLPSYFPVPEHNNMQADELILTTYKVNVQSHSRTQNCKWLTEIYHENPAWINPITARERGIKQADRIRVISELGEIETSVQITPAIVPKVIAISNHCGHWQYGRIASGKATPHSIDDASLQYKWWQNNGQHPNWIIPSRPDPINGQQRWMDTVVKVVPI